MQALIAKHGAATTTRDVMDKTLCSSCDGKVPVSTGASTKSLAGRW